ncbi:hypothetical protein C9890_0501 [Perkinsus sp. BL_2016]|nr:hypothetical protein C9890_0501 [Perkinsus sp. BL_2016]
MLVEDEDLNITSKLAAKALTVVLLRRLNVKDLSEWVDQQFPGEKIGTFIIKIASETTFKDQADLWIKRISDALIEADNTVNKVTLLIDTAVSNCPDEMVILGAAKLALRQGLTVSKAVEIVRIGISHHPDSVELLLALGKLLATLGDFEEARKVVSTARIVQPPTWRVYMKIALIEIMSGNIEKAKHIVNEALGKFPTAWKLHCMRMQLETEAYVDQWINEGIQHCGNKPEIWTVAGDITLQRRSYSITRSLLERGRMRHPESPLLWVKSIQLELHCSLQSNTDSSPAKSLLAKALVACPNSGLLWSLAVQMEDSVTRFSKCAEALKRCPQAEVFAEVGRFFWEIKRDADKAIKWLEKATLTKSNNGDLMLLWIAIKLSMTKSELEKQQVWKQGMWKLDHCNQGIIWNAKKKNFENLRKPPAQLAKDYLNEYWCFIQLE